jgi:hypothetical protein
MFVLGLILLAAAIAMLVVARPRDGKVVPWLESEIRQQLYGFALLVLLALGGFLAVSG